MDTDEENESSITAALDTNEFVPIPGTSKDVDTSKWFLKKNKSINGNATSSIDAAPVALLEMCTAEKERKIDSDIEFNFNSNLADSSYERIGECEAVFSFIKRETDENPAQRRKILTTPEVYYKVIKEMIRKLEQITSLLSRVRKLLVTENIELPDKREELHSIIHGQEIEINMWLLELKKIHIIQNFNSKVSKQTQVEKEEETKENISHENKVSEQMQVEKEEETKENISHENKVSKQTQVLQKKRKKRKKGRRTRNEREY